MEALVIINTIGLIALAIYLGTRPSIDPEDYVCDIDELEDDFRKTGLYKTMDEAFKDHKRAIHELADAAGFEFRGEKMEVEAVISPAGFYPKDKKKKTTKKVAAKKKKK